MSVLPSKCRKYLTEKGLTFEEIDGDQKAIILRGYSVPSGKFNSERVDILIVLPNGYPDVRPDMFFCQPWLKLREGDRFPRAADAAYTFANQSWQQWSRHQDQWRPGTDGIWTMLRRIDNALEIAA